MPDPSPREIGYYYKLMGLFSLAAVVGLLVIDLVRNQRGLSTVHTILFGVAALTCLALIRPDNFHDIFRALMDALPFTKFTKKD